MKNIGSGEINIIIQHIQVYALNTLKKLLIFLFHADIIQFEFCACNINTKTYLKLNKNHFDNL